MALANNLAVAQNAWGGLYPSLFLTSDYRFDGVSFTGHAPTAQASIFWARPDNFYAGIWMSGVDFSDLGDETTSYEVDVYGGYNFHVGKSQLAVELMYSAFPDNQTPGPTYNFYTGKLRSKHSFESFSVDAELSYVPEASYAAGPQWQVKSGTTYRWSDQFSLGGGVGRRWSDNGSYRTFWDVGVTTKWNNVSFDLRYFDTDQSFMECGFVDWCESGIALTLQVDLWN